MVRFPCTVKPSRGRKKLAEPEIQAETTDVSTGGLHIVVSADLGIGTEIECMLQLPVKAFGDRPVAIRCRGKVARIVPQEQGRIGVGVTIEHFEFLRMEKVKGTGSSKER